MTIILINIYHLFAVALFTSAWIEILFELRTLLFPTVALFTSAWIEINNSTSDTTTHLRSHSLRVRGLKFLLWLHLDQYNLVALFTSAWIEITSLTYG